MPEPPSRPRRQAVLDIPPIAPTIATPPAPRSGPRILPSVEFFSLLRWIDGSPLVIEPYRRRLFTRALDERDEMGRPRFNLILCGRAKKNFKSCDLALAELYALITFSPHGNACF